MIFIVIFHFPLIIEQCIGKPSIYSQDFLNCVHPVPRFQSALSIHFVKSSSNGILHPDKQTYPGFPFNFLVIHFYMCINLQEKTAVVLFHSIQVTVVSQRALFIQEVQQSESASPTSVFTLSNAMLPHCTKIEMVCFCIKLGDWLWITLGQDKGIFFFFIQRTFHLSQGKEIVVLGKDKHNEVFSQPKISPLAVRSVTYIIFFLISFNK